MFLQFSASLHYASSSFREFVRTAWEDTERFKEQKDRDLHEALISYAIMQISMCKKVWGYVCFYFFSTVVVCSSILACLKMPDVLWCRLFISSARHLFFSQFSHFCCPSLKIALVFHTLSGNPSVVQCQRVFQQNVRHFHAAPKQ